MTLTLSQRELADIIIELIREDPQVRGLIERIAAKARFEKINGLSGG